MLIETRILLLPEESSRQGLLLKGTIKVQPRFYGMEIVKETICSLP